MYIAFLYRVKKLVSQQIFLDVVFITVFITQIQRQTLPKTRRGADGKKTVVFPHDSSQR
jgi:hypothetical protein